MATIDKIKNISRAESKIFTLFASYLIIGTVFYHLIEKWSWLDSLYFSVITLATVGYGDFAPKTPAGKIFTIFYVFIGVGIFIFVANYFLKKRVEHRVDVNQSKHKRD